MQFFTGLIVSFVLGAGLGMLFGLPLLALGAYFKEQAAARKAFHAVMLASAVVSVIVGFRLVLKNAALIPVAGMAPIFRAHRKRKESSASDTLKQKSADAAENGEERP